MDNSIKQFFKKNSEQNYSSQYDIDHGPRLDAMIQKWNLLEDLKNKSVCDIGGGLGFLGKRINLPKDQYYVIDGAEVPDSMKVCNGNWICSDLDYEKFGDINKSNINKSFDTSFCLETLEHLSNPYNCLAEIKKITKENGDIFISIPHANVWHNYIYPALMVDPRGFAQFLGQMALPIVEYWLWDKGWNAHHFKCRNAPWTESKMLYPKNEEKFYGKTPIEYVNL